jgi:hypothetical protein
MNRAERRRTRARIRHQAPGQDFRGAVECPDCNSVAAVVELAPGYFRGVVQHDDSCPWYASLKHDLQ